jgi:hypothetical protein
MILRNLDIILGILAWVFSLACWFTFDIFPPGIYTPIGWLVCIIALMITRKRPICDYWWVWCSFGPVALKCVWVVLIIIIFARELIFKS